MVEWKGGAGVEIWAEEEVAAGKAPRTAAACRRYMQGELTKKFPRIVKGFVQAAETGSVTHVKLATELLRATEPKRPRRPPSVTELLKKMSE